MKMLIGGKKVDSRDKRTIDVINPATGAFLDTIPMATREDVDEAVENAKKGQKEWAAIPLLQREKIIHQFLRLLEEHKREIISVCTRECGKHVGTTIFEFNQTPTLFSGYMESAKRMDGKLLVPGTELGHDGKTAQDLIMVLHEPLGTVAAIVPFNAPMLLYSFKVAPALAAGNSVIVKPPTDNPLTDIMITELLLEAGVPGNTVQIVTGSGSKVGNWLVQNPGVDARRWALALPGLWQNGWRRIRWSSAGTIPLSCLTMWMSARSQNRHAAPGRGTPDRSASLRSAFSYRTASARNLRRSCLKMCVGSNADLMMILSRRWSSISAMSTERTPQMKKSEA